MFLGPRSRGLESKEFDRVPIGGWVGDMPRDGGPAAPFATRFLLVAVERDVLHLVPMDIKMARGLNAVGGPAFKAVRTYRESLGSRVVLLDPKNRLRYVWLEPRPVTPTDR